MQHVNNDMDDVFKKAGEDYPLRAGTPDWEKVQQALNTQAPPEPGRKKNTWYLWLLCLLPLMFICNRYVGTGENTVTATANRNANTPGETAQPHPQHTESKVIDDSKPLSRRDTGIGKDNNVDINETVIAEHQTKKTIKEGSTIKRKEDGLTLQQRSGLNKGTTGKSFKENSTVQDEVIPPIISEQRTAVPISMQTIEGGKPIQDLKTSFLLDSISNALATSSILHPETVARKKMKSTLQYKRGLYLGIVGSADLTTVKMQKTTNVGWQYGLLAGYAFHKKWSIEAGVFADRKHYYTKGEYFDKGRAYLPPNSDITELTGSCTMLEFPLAVKYNLSSGRRSQFFVTTGVSSYVMKKEDYAYTYYYRGSGTYAVHDKSYRNATTDLFSVLQLSGGVTHSVGKSTMVRVEPYLKLPLAGLGYGNLHFTSLGLSAGVVKSFGRR